MTSGRAEQMRRNSPQWYRQTRPAALADRHTDQSVCTQTDTWTLSWNHVTELCRYYGVGCLNEPASAFHLKIAGELKIDRAGKSRRAMRDRLHDRFPDVAGALGRPDLGPTLLLLKPMSALELSWYELPSSNFWTRNFLPRVAMLARYILSPCVRP